jgi:recombinational DNA repair protein (RecF pathway)
MHYSAVSSEIQKLSEKEWSMKLQNAVRMNLMLVGLGAALLLASSARAQQDVDPTTFDVNPGTVKVEAAAQKTAQAVAPVTVESEGLVQTALWGSKATQEETDLARVTILDALLAMILMAGVGLIVMYAKAATRRERRLQPMLQDSHYAPASGATTH